jgi:hypothetical protein
MIYHVEVDILDYSYLGSYSLLPSGISDIVTRKCL